ncbi:MAG: hypothetical protein PHQ74_06020 [Crocinitomicaceae bacterium]|nr:hypothetical protein [Crocinitomicaceae bacterium]
MKILLTIIIPLCCFSCSSQDFEGIISYKTTYTSKIDGVSATEIFGQEVAYDTTYFKNGFFLNKSSTDFMNYLLWRSEDKKQYFKNKYSADTIWFDQTDSRPSQIDSFLVQKKAETVGGYDCDLLLVYKNDRLYKYYYNPDFKLDPSYYQQYTNSSKFEIMKIMKSPYLRLHIISPRDEVDMVCTNLEVTKLSDETFAIPKEGNLIKFEYYE